MKHGADSFVVGLVTKVESSKDFFSAGVGDEIVVASSALDLFGLGDFCCKKIEKQLLEFISLVQNRSYLYNRISIKDTKCA